MPSHPRGRYLAKKTPNGRWTLHEKDGRPLRELNSYEDRFVNSAHEPASISRNVRLVADHWAGRALALAQEAEQHRYENEQLRAELRQWRSINRIPSAAHFAAASLVSAFAGGFGALWAMGVFG